MMKKLQQHIFCLLILSLVILIACSKKNQSSIFERLQPIPKEGSGFRMDGYWVWGGAVIQVDSVFHLFASRWPKKNKFPDDYFRESEIVRATSESANGPYTFREIVIGERDSCFWDSNMAHNPAIYKIGDLFVLFYIGSDFTTLRNNGKSLLRRVGYATSPNIEGPWNRCDTAVIAQESNNPALFVEPDNRVKLIFRDENLVVKIAEAQIFMGPYHVKNENVWGAAKLEDFFLFKNNGLYHLICEDNVGEVTGHVRWGAHLFSENGIDGWKVYKDTVVYDHEIKIDDGSVLHCTRRERPQLLIQDGKVTHLLTGVFDGDNSWCQPVKLHPPLLLKK